MCWTVKLLIILFLLVPLLPVSPVILITSDYFCGKSNDDRNYLQNPLDLMHLQQNEYYVINIISQRINVKYKVFNLKTHVFSNRYMQPGGEG